MDLSSLQFAFFHVCGWIIYFVLNQVAGDVCVPTWRNFNYQFSIGGVQQQIADLASCLVYCQSNANCVAADFNPSISTPCWTHTDPSDLVGDNVYSGSTQTQYIINRTCTNLPSSDCLLTWKRLPRTHSVYAVAHDYWTEYDCFTFCAFTPNCPAADFDIASSPPCWIHTSYNDLTPDYTYDDSDTAVQYRMNRTCPPPAAAGFQLGQCVGHPLKSGNWCSAGQEIHIIEASYKISPLCCNGINYSADVPDNPSLMALNVFRQNDNGYIGELLACEGKRDCPLISKAYESPDITNDYCSAQPHKTNYVFVTYSCQDPGHTDPSIATMSDRPSSAKQTLSDGQGTHRISTSPDGVSPPIALNSMSYQSNNRDALILGGFGVALGGLAVLILIVLAVLWYLRYKREQNTKSNNVAMNPMYKNNGSSSVSGDSISNGRYGNQLKGFSSADVYPEAEAISE